jgi:hypothetical protein
MHIPEQVAKPNKREQHFLRLVAARSGNNVVERAEETAGTSCVVDCSV